MYGRQESFEVKQGAWIKTRRVSGFSLVEVIMALGLLAVIILGVGLLSLRIIRSSTESNDRTAAAAVATTVMEQVILQGQTDANFWNSDHTTTPYLQNSVKAGSLDYEYEVFAQTLVDSAGDEIGDGLEHNRVKRVTLNLYWYDTRTSERQGFGKLDLSVVRLVSEQGLSP